MFGYTNDDQWDRNAEKYELLRRLLREEDVTWEGATARRSSASRHGPDRCRTRSASGTAAPRAPARPSSRARGGATRCSRPTCRARSSSTRRSSTTTASAGRPTATTRRRRSSAPARRGSTSTPTRERAVEEFRPSYEAFQAYARANGLPPQFTSLEDAIARGSYFVGSPQQVLEQFHRYHDTFGHEIQHVGNLGSLDDPVRRRSIELFAAEVLPVLHTSSRTASGTARPPPPSPPDHDPLTRPGEVPMTLVHPDRSLARGLARLTQDIIDPALGGADVIRRSPHIGTEIRGLDLTAPLDAATKDALRQEFAARKVLVFRGVNLSPAEHVAAVSIFDEPFDHPTAVRHPEHPLVYPYEVRTTGKASRWHVGGLWRDPVFGIESLVYEVVPETGGDTIWADLQAAYDDLSPAQGARRPRRRALRRQRVQLRPGRDRARRWPTRPCTRSSTTTRATAAAACSSARRRIGFTGVSETEGRALLPIPDRARVAVQVPGPLRLGRRRLRAVGQPGHVARRRRRLRRRAAGLPQGHRRMTGREIALGVLDLVPIPSGATPATRSTTRSTWPAAPRRRAMAATGSPSTTSTRVSQAPHRRCSSRSSPARHSDPRRLRRRADGSPHAAVGRRAVRHHRCPASRPHRPRPRPQRASGAADDAAGAGRATPGAPTRGC